MIITCYSLLVFDLLLLFFLHQELVCGDPPSIERGQIDLIDDDITFGSVAMYSCSFWYYLDGSVNLTCSRSSRWEPRTPECSK